jgi:diguanylate cyclase (GGDEF)-like protein
VEQLHVLVVEDSAADLELVLDVLDACSTRLEARSARTLTDALAQLAAGPVDVVLADLSLPDADGLDAVRALRAAAPDLPILVLTGLDDAATAAAALAAGAQDYVPKDDVAPRLLDRAVRYAVERARAEAEVRRSARWTAALLDGLEAPTCAVDAGGRVVALNAAMSRHGSDLLLACEPGDDLAALWCSPSASRQAAGLLAGLQDVLTGRLPRHELECAGPDDRWWSVRTTPLPGGTGAVVTQVEVTSLKQAQQQLTAAALHDPLTGLPNRTLLTDRLEQAVAHAVRAGRLAAVLFIDLDRFKAVNDALGHSAGDALLVAAADRLRSAARESDTVARVSGDEFVVAWLADDAAGAQGAADRFVGALNGHLDVDGRTLSLSASAGLATTGGAESAEEVLRLADEAMYAAKSRGGSRLEVASSELRGLLARRTAVEVALEQALVEDRFEVHYQPVVRLADGEPLGVEALVRLRAADGTLLPPGDFIDVAERSGLVVAMGLRVLRTACREAASWTGAAHDLSVAVNLSTRQLAQPDLVDSVRACLAESGLRPGRLVLEVTESAVVDDAEAALRALTALRALGVLVAIDDFGTGYSSFLYLKQFPVDILKIDRAFVGGMLRSPDDAAIVASIVRLGHDVGVVLVAEGVETEEQRTHLVRLGCEQAQGFLFARPVPAAEVAAALAGTRREVSPPALPGPRPPAPVTDAATLARIVQLTHDGASPHTIAALLNREAVPSPTGRRWHPRAVARCLEVLVPVAS